MGIGRVTPYEVQLAFFSGFGGGFSINIAFTAGTASENVAMFLILQYTLEPLKNADTFGPY